MIALYWYMVMLVGGSGVLVVGWGCVDSTSSEVWARCDSGVLLSVFGSPFVWFP